MATTSDSEGFESADEEIEPSQSIKEVDNKGSTFSKEEICENEPTSKPSTSNKDDSRTPLNRNTVSKNITEIENVVEEIKTDIREVVTEKLDHRSKAFGIKEASKAESSKSAVRRITNLEKQAQKSEVKPKQGSKKLGMKLSSVKEDVKNNGSEELSKTDPNKESTAVFVKNVVRDPIRKDFVETSSVETKSNKESSLKAEGVKQPVSKSETRSVKSKSANILDSVKSSVVEHKSVEKSSVSKAINKSPSGDGWEVEEEDGFEVPVSLSTKPKNEIIQSEREISPVLEKLSAVASHSESKGQGWGSWGGWGVTSLLSTATESVSTFSSHVTSGLSTVLESSLGVPDPEELAKHVAQEEKEKESNQANKSEEPIPSVAEDAAKTEGLGFSGLGSLVSGVSLFSTKVLSGGLDTLETLGKKTMEVLQEGDPMLRKKRAMFFQDPDKPVLSQILKEAKEKAENSDKEQAEKEAARKAHFETLFDDYQGLVHLEALEMLSKQCTLKLQSILVSYSGDALIDLQETLSEVKELCELPEDEDEEEVGLKEEFEKKITEYMKSLHANLSSSKIIQVYNEIDKQLKEITDEKISSVDLHQKAISSMAEFTACAMECFHKGAELVLTKAHRSTADEAENFVLLTTTFCSQVSSMANQFTSLLTKWDPVANNAYITNIFLEAGNSSSYIQNACQLLLPVIQVGAVS